METEFLQVLETIENPMPKGSSQVIISETFSVLWAFLVGRLIQFLAVLGNSAKSLFVDLALSFNKINQRGSKAAPGTARAVLMGAGRPPRVIDLRPETCIY